MGLFDEILAQALGTRKKDEREKQSSSLVAGLLDLLDEPETGGVEGLAQRSQSAGIGDVVASWIGTGGNRSISPDQVTSLLGARPTRRSRAATAPSSTPSRRAPARS